MSNSLPARQNAPQAKVAVLVGSLRQGSLNRRLAQLLAVQAPQGVSLEIIEIGQLPLYDEDLDVQGQVPDAWTAFRDRIKAVDAVLFVTPEYNRSVPAALKNAIDVGSRPYGQSVWNGKPAAIISTSQGALGGFGANHHLRQSLVFLDMPILQQPEAYIGNAAALFDGDGQFAREETRGFFANFLNAFASWIGAVTAKSPSAKAAA